MTKNSDIIKIGFDYRASLEQFEKETNGVFDGISEKAGKQKISIQLDAKNDKVIEKIKELQKLKLDKFTFEFGESGLAEQLKTFDQLEKKITEIINLSKGLGDITSKANGKQAIQSELDLYHMIERRKVSYDEIIDKIQTIIKLQEKSKSLEGKKSSDGKYYQELFDEYVNWSDKDNTLNNITDRLKEIYSKFNGKITLIDESHIKEVAYLLDMVKGAGESLSGLNSKEKTFFNNKRFSNESLFNFTNSDGLLNEQIEVAEKELSSLYEWFNKFEGVSLSDSIGMEISRLTRDIQAGGKEASEYAEQLLKIFNIKLSDTTTVATPFKEEIDNANKLKEIANKTTITFEDFKTIIANLPSDKIEQLNKMLNRTLELTSDTGTSLEVMTSELGKYFTITGTRSSTSFFLSNEGEFTRKPNKNKTNFVDDEIYTKGMKYDPSDLADFAWKLQKQEQQALATAQAEEKLAETEKNLGKSTSTVDDSKFDELKADVTEIREELNGVKEKISAIDSEGFEHVKADVEKTVESVKELNSELTEVKSKLDSASTSPVETNISLGNGVAESFDKAEEKIESVNEKLQESKKFVNDVRQAFMHIVGRASDRDALLEQYPELSDFKNRKNINNARAFLNTDEWKDFLSTLPQAHAYLESIGYDFERIYKLTDEEIAWFKGLNLDELVKRHWSVTGTPDKADYKEIRATYQAYQKELSNQTLLSNPIEDKNISSGNEVTKHQIDAEVKLNAEIEKREDILRELAQLQEKLTVGEDFHGNDRYFADALPTEKDIRDADARIKKLTGSNNIFDVDKLIEDRNRWLSEVRYSLEEYENLIKTNNQKALDDYTSQGLTRIDGAESFFAFEDNNFSIASRFAEEKNKIEAEIGDLYNDLDKLENKLSESLSSSTPIKDTNISLGNEVIESQNKIQEELKKTDEIVQKILYHYGLLSSYNGGRKSHQFGDEITAYKEGKRNGNRGWADGTGTYVTNDVSEFKGIVSEDFKKFFALDVSKLKLYEAHIEQEAEKFYNFQHKLEQFVLALGSGYSGFDENISDVTSESLYKEAQEVFAKYPKIFKEVFKDFDDFDSFIDKMINLVSESGMNENGFESKNVKKLMEFKKKYGIDDIKTRFLKELGFQGTDLSGTSYGGIKTGSVIFDIETAPVLSSAKTIQEVLDAIGVKAEDTKYKINEIVDVQKDVSSTPIKDTFQGKTEASEMGKVATAVDEAVQAKKDFATANEGVQDSVDGSKSKLELETELMERLAKSAREAADAKKEFVEANKQIQDSVDDTGKSVKKDKYKNKSKISEDEYTGKSDYYASIANQKLKNSGNTILGETVSTELVDGLVKVIAKIKTADDTWKTFSAKIDADGNMFEQRFRTITKGVDKLETELKNFGLDTNPALTYGETLKKAEEIRSSLKLDDSYTIKVDSNELVTITQKLSDVKSSTTSVTQTFKSAQDAIEHFGKEASSSAEKTTVALKGVKASAESTGEAVDESASHLDKISTKLDKYRKDFNNFSAVPDADHRFASFETQLDGLNAAISKLETHQNALKDKGFVDEADISETKRLSTEIDNLIEKIKKVPQSKRGYKDVAVSKMAEKIQSILEQHPRLAKKAKAEIQGYYNELASGNPTRPLDEILDRVNKIIQGQREAGRTGKGFIDILSDKALYGQAAQLAGYYLSLTDFIRYGKQMVDTVIEIDTALTELRKVSDATEQRLTENFKNSAKTAKDLGATVSDVISATADWARMGYNVDDAEELARISTLYKNVGDGIEIEEANNSLISTLQGFQLTADDAESVIDKFNEVANNFAIDSAGIGEALQRSAASFNAANTDLSKSIALITATNEVVQNPEVVGTLWKTMSARIRGAKTELEELGEETDEYTETTSKLRDLVKGLTGFDIMADEDTFKDIYEIILGIGQEWENLTDVEQASLGEALAGKRSANALYAVLGNLDTLEDVYKTAEKSAGSAMREQENYEKSIQYSLERLTASAQEWSAALVDSGVIKWFVDLANAIVEVSTAITPLGTLALGGGLFAGIKNVGKGKMYPFIVLNSQQQYVFFRIRKFSYCQ